VLNYLRVYVLLRRNNKYISDQYMPILYLLRALKGSTQRTPSLIGEQQSSKKGEMPHFWQ